MGLRGQLGRNFPDNSRYKFNIFVEMELRDMIQGEKASRNDLNSSGTGFRWDC